MNYIKNEIIKYLKSHSGSKVKHAITDIDGILRGKVIHKDKFLSILEKGFGFCDVVFGWDSSDKLYDNIDFTGWHTGFPDAIAKVDISTFRKVPWDNDIPFFLADFWDNKDNPLSICPRNLLKKIRQNALEAGFTPFFSQEFEWFNFKETPQSLHEKNFNNIKPITPGMFGYSILRSSYPIPETHTKTKTKKGEPELRRTFFNNLFDWLTLYD